MDDFGWIDEYLVADARRESTSVGIELGISSNTPSTELEPLALAQALQGSTVELQSLNGAALDQHDESVSRHVSSMEFPNYTSGNLETSSSSHRNGQKIISCAECDEEFNAQEDLGNHAQETGHDAYTCEVCGAKFSRYDVLVRHRSKHSAPTKLWPCTLCRKWKAPNGFARKDHLLQHQRNYHHVDGHDRQYGGGGNPTDTGFFAHCTHEGCSKYRPTNIYGYWAKSDMMFESRSAFTKHMRDEHDETPFPCRVHGCKKANGKGFFRKRSLMRHMKAVHEIDEGNTENQEDSVGEMGALTMDNDATYESFTTPLDPADPAYDEPALW
ncbi:hypothetical protein B0O99DRAFT_669336 [Bisporella sp. PMI_857]|nr:hypothetical protein B0O99DRAFT_669336 [Bisporella sp. PMI_857]